MPRRALIDKRPWLLASLAAAAVYYLLRDNALPGLLLTTLKGAGVAFLAVYAWERGPAADARAIALVMAFGALGDVLIEVVLEAGAAAFLIGHLLAIRLYWRRRRADPAKSQIALALALLVLTPLVAWLLPADRAAAPGVALYALGLGAMAATARLSLFSRNQVGLGAVLFVASDLLIFARIGPLAASPLPDLLIWPLYYIGQLLICTGVLGEVRRQSGTAPLSAAVR